MAAVVLGSILLAVLALPFVVGLSRYVPPGEVSKAKTEVKLPSSGPLVEASREKADLEGLAGRLRADIDKLAGSEAAGGRPRTAGSDRAREVASEIAERFRAILRNRYGGKNGDGDKEIEKLVTVQSFPMVAPVTEESAELKMGDNVTYRLHPLMPNAARTCTIAAEGNTLSAPVVWGGNGQPRSLSGKDVRGSILVLDDDRGQDWMVACSLGARAMVFIEPDDPGKLQLDLKVLGCALDIPRFWICRREGLELRDRLLAAEAGGGPAESVPASLTCRVDWERCEGSNVYCLIPGTAGSAADGRARDVTVVLSHYDSTSLVPDVAPGAEGAASLAAALELALRLSRNPPERSVLFIVSGAHYSGMLGEKHAAEVLRRPVRKLVKEIADCDGDVLGQNAGQVLLASGQAVSGLTAHQKGLLSLIAALLAVAAGVCTKVFGLDFRRALVLFAVTAAVGATGLTGLGFWMGRERGGEASAAEGDLAAAGSYGQLRTALDRLTALAPEESARMLELVSAQEEKERSAIVARGRLEEQLKGWGGQDPSEEWRTEYSRRAGALHEAAVEAVNYPEFVCALLRTLASAAGCEPNAIPADDSPAGQEKLQAALGARFSLLRTSDPQLFRALSQCEEAVNEIENRQKRVGAGRQLYLRLTGYAAFLAELGPAMPERMRSCVGVDLTSHGDRLAAFFKGAHVNQCVSGKDKGMQDAVAPLCEYLSEAGSAEARALGLARPEADWDYLVNTAESIGGLEWTVLAPGAPYFGAEIFSLAGFPSATVGTVQDGRWLLDTPLDTPERMDFKRLAAQVEIFCRAVSGAVHAGAGQIGPGDATDWKALAAALTAADAAPAAARLRGMLDPDAVGLARQLAAGNEIGGDGLARLTKALTEVMNSPGLYDREAFSGMKLTGEVGTLRERAENGRLPASELKRFNRLLLERALPGLVRLSELERGIRALERTEQGCAFKPGTTCLRVHGEVLEHNPGKSTTLSNIPVPDAVVFNRREPLGERGSVRLLTTAVRPDNIALADRYGAYEFFGLSTSDTRRWGDADERLEAFDISPVTGEICKAPVNGPRGGQFGDHWRRPKRNDDRFVLGLFACQALNLPDIADMRGFSTLESQFTVVTTYLGSTDAVPMSMGWSGMGNTMNASYPEHALVVFCERREAQERGDAAGGHAILPQHVKMTLGRPKLAGVRWPILGIGPDGAKGASLTGEGLYVLGSSLVRDPDGPDDDAAKWTPQSPASGEVLPPMVVMAQDLYRLDDHRLEILEKAGVKNTAVVEQHEEAGRELEACRKARDEKRWDDMLVRARSSWGYESRAYPNVQGTVADVVKGLIFYLFLMLPFAFFMERLFFAYPDINRQLTGVFGMFMVSFAVLYVVHPAFGITSSAPMILLAFITLALAILVMGMVGSRFRRELEALQKRPGRSRKADMDRFNAAISAFLLGINNMRRRKMRTTLTMVTLVLLTFSVLSFSSIESTFGVNKRVPPGTGEKPPYEGVLVRNESWQQLDEMAARVLRDEFFDDGECVVAPRAWSPGSGSEGGGRDVFVCRSDSPESGFEVPALLGVRPIEQSVTGLGSPEMLLTGRMFKPHEARAGLPICLLDADLMRRLGLDPGAVPRGEDIKDLTDPENRRGLPHLTVKGEELAVIGVLKTELYSRVFDIDGEAIVPVDSKVENWERTRGQTSGSEQVEFRQYQHLEHRLVPVVPYDWLMSRGGGLFSVALKPADPSKVSAMAEERLLRRLSVPMFVSARDEGGDVRTTFMSAAIGNSVSGVGSLLVPMLIAALIVLNTMLGSVYEREREISIYGSLGLAPVHIGSLFIAESAVYAVVSAVLGYLLGQTVSKLVVLGGAGGLLAGFSLNYSSMSAVFSACFIIIVVMLSAAYPAFRAGQLSVPDVERIWKFPKPEGDRLIFLFPFTVSGEQALGVNVHLKHFFDDHANQSVGEFYTSDTRFGYLEKKPGVGSSYRLSSRVWIAPFDFGISQTLDLDTVLAEGETDIYETRLTLTRVSGAPEAWVKMNHRFMKSMRKQFLLWRMFTNEERAWHVARARELLGEAAPSEPQAGGVQAAPQTG